MTENRQSNACIRNFRDVGESVNVLAGLPLLSEGRLLRGGAIPGLDSLEAIGSPQSILNLQATADPGWESVVMIHCPAPSQGVDVYDARSRAVRAWLRGIVRRFATDLCCPVYVHCFSGADRTGVVVASVLRILDIADETIAAEYCLSDGVPSGDPIRAFLSGVGDARQYFRGIDLECVRASLSGVGS
jgi:protein-tyrosine phosphatase